MDARSRRTPALTPDQMPKTHFFPDLRHLIQSRPASTVAQSKALDAIKRGARMCAGNKPPPDFAKTFRVPLRPALYGELHRPTARAHSPGSAFSLAASGLAVHALVAA